MMKTAIVMYCPVVHNGYVNFLKKNGSSDIAVFLIDNSVFDDLDKKDSRSVQSIKRDLRALETNVARDLIKQNYEGLVDILGIEKLNILSDFEKIILPEDSFSRAFVKNYIPNFENVEFVEFFLRWDMPNSTNRNDMEVDGTVSTEELLNKGLLKHLDSAKSEQKFSPDWWRQIGSVLVRDNEEILRAHNTHLPTEHEVGFAGDPRCNFNAGESIEISKAIHSEAGLIAAAASSGISTKGCDLFVTTFPCPACANLIALSGIKKIYFIDGYSLVGAVDVLKEYGVEIIRVQ